MFNIRIGSIAVTKRPFVTWLVAKEKACIVPGNVYVIPISVKTSHHNGNDFMEVTFLYDNDIIGRIIDTASNMSDYFYHDRYYANEDED